MLLLPFFSNPVLCAVTRAKEKKSITCVCACVRIMCWIMRALGVQCNGPKEVYNCGL